MTLETATAPVATETGNSTQAAPGVEGSTPPVETKPEEPRQPSQEEIDFAKRFTSLTRKERDILAREERIRNEMQSVNEWRKSQDLIKQNPLKFLEQNGWDFNKLADFALNDQKPTVNHEMQELRDQIQALIAEKEEEKQNSARASEEKHVAEFKSGLKENILSKGDKYELINQFEYYDMVYDIMNQHYMDTAQHGQSGEILDIDIVANHVENLLEGQLEKAAKTKKFTSRFATPVKEEVKTGELPRYGEIDDRSPKTLTNAHVSGSGSNDSTGYLDEDASKARSAKILEEMWKRKTQR